jgi:hypothetical protein
VAEAGEGNGGLTIAENGCGKSPDRSNEQYIRKAARNDRQPFCQFDGDMIPQKRIFPPPGGTFVQRMTAAAIEYFGGRG